MRRGIRCWKGWKRKHERGGKACGLIPSRRHRGSGVEALDWHGFVAGQESRIETEADRQAYYSWPEWPMNGQMEFAN